MRFSTILPLGKLAFAAATTFLFCTATIFDATSAEAKTRKKKREKKSRDSEVAHENPSSDSVKNSRMDPSFDIQGNFGMDSFAGKESENKSTYTGFGFGFVGHKIFALGPQFSAPVGGGIRMSNVTYQGTGIKSEISLTTLRIDMEGMFAASPVFLIGGFFGYDILLSGSAKVSGSIPSFDGEEGESFSATSPISGFSQITFGARAEYLIDRRIFMGGDFGITSGSLKVGEGTAAPFSGNQINGLVGMRF